MLKNPIIKFALTFIILIIIFLIPIRIVNHVYATIYQGVATTVFDIIVSSDNRIVQCDLKSTEFYNYTLLVKIGNPQKKSSDGRILSRVLRIDIRTFGNIAPETDIPCYRQCRWYCPRFHQAEIGTPPVHGGHWHAA